MPINPAVRKILHLIGKTLSTEPLKLTFYWFSEDGDFQQDHIYDVDRQTPNLVQEIESFLQWASVKTKRVYVYTSTPTMASAILVVNL